jgi:endothelin-converting enzyme/putative endopeptidase
MRHALLLSAASVIALTACSAPTDTNSADTSSADQATQSSDAAMAAAPVIGEFGFDIAGMDDSVDPGEDFFEFANGAWLDEAEIPGDRSNYGMFTKLAIEADDDVMAIIDDASATADAAPGSNAQLVGDLYASWMNADAIDESGVAPAQPYLDEINGATSFEDIAALFATVHYASPYSVGVVPDPAETSRYTLFVGQSGLGLPDRDYYFNEDEASQRYRDAYVDYIEQVFTLSGIENGAEKARAVMDLETRLADAHWEQERTREITEIYNEYTLEGLQALAPEFNWAVNLDTLGLGGRDHFVVTTPSAISAAGEIFSGEDLDTLKAWMSFHFLSDRASWLSSDLDQASFDFYSRTLNGVEEQREREKRGVDLIGGALGHAIGQIYVDRHFPPSSKAAMEGLVSDLQTAFRARLETLAWMDEETRAQALEKLSTFEPRIGYPEIWDDFTGLEINDGDYFANRMRMSQFSWDGQLEDLAEGVDRREWSWPPQIVNASYNPLLNQITFPAGILQAPFFDPSADMAINFGGIGAVIGHEIGHGFDDQGRRFDAQGRIRDWWTEETNQLFLERSDALVAQYNEYAPLDGYTVNGRFTLGENIGDLGGVEMAYAAWRDYVEANYGGEAPVIDGLTGDQRFFLGWAQVWRRLYREDNLISRLSTDPHSPSEFRVNGVVRNMDAWYAAFDVSEDDDLYLPPEQRVSIW